MRLMGAIVFVILNLLLIEATDRTKSADDDGGGSVLPSTDPVIKFKSDQSESATVENVRPKNGDSYKDEYEYVDEGETVGNAIDKKSETAKEEAGEEDKVEKEESQNSQDSDESFPNDVFLSLRNISGGPGFRGFTQRNDIEDLQASASDNVNVTVNDTKEAEDSSTGTLRALRDAGHPPFALSSADEVYPPFSKPPNTIDNADFSDCARQGEWKPIGVDGSPIDLDAVGGYHHGHGHGHGHGHHHHAAGFQGDILQSVGSYPVANKLIPHWHDGYLSGSDNQGSHDHKHYGGGASDSAFGSADFGSGSGGSLGLGLGGGHDGGLSLGHGDGSGGGFGGGLGGGHGGGHGSGHGIGLGGGSGSGHGSGNGGGLAISSGGGYSGGFGSGASLHGGSSAASAEYHKIKSSSMLAPPPVPPIIFGKKPGHWKSHKSKHKFHYGKGKRPSGSGFSSFTFGGNGGGGFGSFGSSHSHSSHGGSFGGGSFSSGHLKGGSAGFGNGGGSSLYSGHFKYGSGGFGSGSGGGFGGGGGSSLYSGHHKGNGGFSSGGFGSGGSGHHGYLKGGSGGSNGGSSSGSGLSGFGGSSSVFTGHLKEGSFDGSTSVLTGHLKEGNGVAVFDGHLKLGNAGFDGNGVSVFTGHLKEGKGGFGSGSGSSSSFSGHLKGGSGNFDGNGGGSSSFSGPLSQGGGSSSSYSGHLSLGSGGSSFSSGSINSGYSDHSVHDGGSGGSLLQGGLDSGSSGYYSQGSISGGTLGHLTLSSEADSGEFGHHGGSIAGSSGVLSFDNGAAGLGGHSISSETHFVDAGGLSNGYDGNSGSGTADISFQTAGGGHSAESGYSHEDSVTGDSLSSLSHTSGGASTAVVFDESPVDNNIGHSVSTNVLHYESGSGGPAIPLSHDAGSVESVSATASSSGDNGAAIQAGSDGYVHQGLTTTTNLVHHDGDSGNGGHSGSLTFPGGDLIFGSSVLLGNPHGNIATGHLDAANPQAAAANLVATTATTNFGNAAASFSADSILTVPPVQTFDHLGGGGGGDGVVGGIGNVGGILVETSLPHSSYLQSNLNHGGSDQGSLIPDSTFLSTHLSQATREGNSLSDSSLHSHSSQEYPGFVLQAHGVLDDSSTFTCGKNQYHNTKYHTATFQVADNDHPSSIDVIKYNGDAAVIVRADNAPFQDDIYPERKNYNPGNGDLSSNDEEGSSAAASSDKDSTLAGSQYNLYNRKPQTFTQETEVSKEDVQSQSQTGNQPSSDLQSGSDDASFQTAFREGGHKKLRGKYPLRPGKVQFYQKNLKNLKPPSLFGSGGPGSRDNRGERLVSIRDVSSPLTIPLKQYPNHKPNFAIKGGGVPRPRNQPKMIGGPIVVRRPEKNSPKFVRVVRS